MQTIEKHQGFTIIEIFVTLTLLGVLTAVAVPSLTRFIENQKVRASAQKFSSLLNEARGDAVAKLSNRRVCWNEGSSEITRNTVKIAPGFAALIDNGDNVLVREVEFKDSGITYADTRNGNCFVFDSNGRANANIDFVFCKNKTDSSFSQGFSVSRQGRITPSDNETNQLIACSATS